MCHQVSGDLSTAISLNLKAIELTPGQANMARAYLTVNLYIAGRLEEAVEFGRQAVELARSSQNTIVTMHSFPHYAISLAAAGRYLEALRGGARIRA